MTQSTAENALRRFGRPDDLDWVLAHFTIAADLTALRPECSFASADGGLAARYHGLPFAALAFLADDAHLLVDLAARLVSPSEPFIMLVNERQALLVEQAVAVEQVQPEWQMVLTGDPAALDAGAAVELTPADVPAMRDLAADVGLMALEAQPFRHGPAFGIWQPAADGSPLLVAMAGTHLRVPGAVEIGNIATRTGYRRQGFASQAIAALVRAHAEAGRTVFLMVFQTNRPAVALYERLGFQRQRAMFLMRCRLRDGADKGEGE